MSPTGRHARACRPVWSKAFGRPVPPRFTDDSSISSQTDAVISRRSGALHNLSATVISNVTFVTHTLTICAHACFEASTGAFLLKNGLADGYVQENVRTRKAGRKVGELDV